MLRSCCCCCCCCCCCSYLILLYSVVLFYTRLGVAAPLVAHVTNVLRQLPHTFVAAREFGRIHLEVTKKRSVHNDTHMCQVNVNITYLSKRHAFNCIVCRNAHLPGGVSRNVAARSRVVEVPNAAECNVVVACIQKPFLFHKR